MWKYVTGLLIAICFALLHSADAIQCYECTSLKQPQCALGQDFSGVRTVDCSIMPKPNTMEEYLPVTKCSKVVTSDRAGTVHTRGCHFETLGQQNECVVSHNRDVVVCEVCDTDLCNSSVRPAVIGVALLLTAALAHILL